MRDTKKPWINAGYTLFALQGPGAVKVEVLSRTVGKSKSSFYHHFADMEIFISCLLEHHLIRAEAIIEQERACKNVIPELLEVLIDAKLDLLFNRQLRVNRSVPEFAECFQKASAESAEAILGIWAEELGLSEHPRFALMLMTLSMENFYLQITEETLTYEWLEGFIQQLKQMVSEIY